MLYKDLWFGQAYLEEGGVAVSDSALRASLAEELDTFRGKSRGARGTRKGHALFHPFSPLYSLIVAPGTSRDRVTRFSSR